LARFSLGLLTVCMAATRPSSAIQAGSPDSSWWWETKNFEGFIEIAHARRAAGDFAGLASGTTRSHSLRYAEDLETLSRRLRLKLTEMESGLGVGVSVMSAENFRTRNSLTLFQQGLGESDLLPSSCEDLKRFRESVALEVSITGCQQSLSTDTTAEPLRRRRIPSIHSGTWQAAISYWAALQVRGGGR
jgi:hypothetical protein